MIVEDIAGEKKEDLTVILFRVSCGIHRCHTADSYSLQREETIALTGPWYCSDRVFANRGEDPGY